MCRAVHPRRTCIAWLILIRILSHVCYPLYFFAAVTAATQYQAISIPKFSYLNKFAQNQGLRLRMVFDNENRPGARA
jgi:hypothetical protein